MSDDTPRRTYGEERTRANGLVRTGPTRFDFFADDVSLDFPAMGPVVDRIRDALLGPDDCLSPVSAELLLSPWEAFRGVVVPLDVPIRRPCRRCGGRGEVWMDRCVDCLGSGAAGDRVPVQLSVPAGVRDGTRFRFSVHTPSASPTIVEVRIAVQ